MWVDKQMKAGHTTTTAALALCILAGGCASVIKGSTQSIAVSTPPTAGAMCQLSSGQGNWTVVSPGVASVEKSKSDIQIRCTKSGWQDAASTIPSNFEGWTVGNLVLGGLIGVGVDAATGAINDYPHTFQVPMVQATGMPGPAIGAPMALGIPLSAPAPLPTPSPAVYSAYPSARAAASDGSVGQTVLFPVMITNPYHPSWTIGGR